MLFPSHPRDTYPYPALYLYRGFFFVPTLEIIIPIVPTLEFTPVFSSLPSSQLPSKNLRQFFSSLPSSGSESRSAPPWANAQIRGTRAEPQRIVATRLLYRLQYPVPIQVVCKGFTPAHMIVAIRGRVPATFPPRGPKARPIRFTSPGALSLRVLLRAGPTSSFPARILT